MAKRDNMQMGGGGSISNDFEYRICFELAFNIIIVM